MPSAHRRWCHACRCRRVPGQGEDHRALSRRRLQGLRQLRPCERPAGQGRFGPARGRLRDGLRDGAPGEPGAEQHQGRAQGRREPDPRHRPGPRGRGHRVAGADLAAGEGRDRGEAGVPRRLPRDHRAWGARRDGASARPRHGPGAGAAGAQGVGLPGGLPPLGGAVAQGPGKPFGRARAVCGAPPRLRARGGDGVLRAAGVLDRGRAAGGGRRRELHGKAGPARRRRARPARDRHRDHGGGRRTAHSRGAVR